MKSEKIHKLIENAINHRSSCGWDNQHKEACLVKDNELPVKNNVPGEHYYKDNWILKSINWIISMLSGADISVELQSLNGTFEKKMKLMECEINFFMDYFQWTTAGEKALSDKLWHGFGCIKHVWNPFMIDEDFQTGKVKYTYKDCKNIYLDPNPYETNYICEKISLTSEMLLNYFPEYPELEKYKNKDIDIFVVQVKQVVKQKKVAIYIPDTDEIKIFDFDEVEEFKNNNALPEELEISAPLSVEKNNVTEYIYLPEEKKILKKYDIGEDFTYTILKGFEVSDSPYSFGLCFYLIDQQEISVILMTMLLLSAMKHHKPIRILHPEAIENYDDIKDSLHLPGIDIIISSEWQERHPNVKPIEFIDPPKFNSELDYLEKKIAEVIKSTTGVTDSMQGIPQYAGLSGVAIAQFQQQAKVYHKKDYIQWDRFIKDNVKTLMELVKKYRNYPHKLLGIDETGRNVPVDVNSSNETTLDKTNYIITVMIDENQEAVKQMEQDLALKLHQMGLMTDEDLMAKMPFKNIDTLIENLQARKQEQAMLQQQMQQSQQFNPAYSSQQNNSNHTEV